MAKSVVWVLFWTLMPLTLLGLAIMMAALKAPVWVTGFEFLGTLSLVFLARREIPVHLRRLTSRSRQRTA